VQATVAAQIGGRVADGLDAQRAAFFQILLDARVLVEDVDDHVDAARDDPGRKGLAV